jgi:hypothetical protein
LQGLATEIAADAVVILVARLREATAPVGDLTTYVVCHIYNRFLESAHTVGRRDELFDRLSSLPARDPATTAGQQHLDAGVSVLKACRLMSAGFSHQEAAGELGMSNDQLATLVSDWARAGRAMRRLWVGP